MSELDKAVRAAMEAVSRHHVGTWGACEERIRNALRPLFEQPVVRTFREDGSQVLTVMVPHDAIVVRLGVSHDGANGIDP